MDVEMDSHEASPPLNSTPHIDTTTEPALLEMPPPTARPKTKNELAVPEKPKKELTALKSPKQRSGARKSVGGLDQELRFSRNVHVLVVEDNAVNAKVVSKVDFPALSALYVCMFYVHALLCQTPSLCPILTIVNP
jgi:hypothetical protein